MQVDNLGAKMLRRLSLALAVLTAAIACWLSMGSDAPTVVAQAALPAQFSDIQDVRIDLARSGYVHVPADSTHTPSSVSRIIHTEAWVKDGVTVNVSDGYPGSADVFVVDSVVFGKTATYSMVWCVGDPRDASRLVYMVEGARTIRTDVESGVAVPTQSRSEPRISKVARSFITCFMV